MTDFGSIESFRELKILAPNAVLRTLGDEIEKSLPGSQWTRDREKELSMRQVPMSPANVFVFLRNEDEKLPSGSLSLVVDADEATVGNIVPVKYGQLTHAQYNSLLEDFLSVGVRPLENKLRLKIEMTDATSPLTAWLTEAAAKKLKGFSDLANKSTGSSHPLDEKRWLDFIVQAHRDGSKLTDSYLRRWLVEVERWPEDQADNLVSEYSFGRALLGRAANS